MSTCNWLDLESLRSWPTMPKNFPGTVQDYSCSSFVSIQSFVEAGADSPNGAGAYEQQQNKHKIHKLFKIGWICGERTLTEKCMGWTNEVRDRRSWQSCDRDAAAHRVPFTKHRCWRDEEVCCEISWCGDGERRPCANIHILPCTFQGDS